MFFIKDTSRSLTVALPDKGHAIASDCTGSIWHHTGLSFDVARAHVERLNRIAAELPDADPQEIFALYHKAHFAAAEYAAFVEAQAKHCRCSERLQRPCDGVLAGGLCDDMQDDLCDDDRVSPAYEEDTRDPHGLGGV